MHEKKQSEIEYIHLHYDAIYSRPLYKVFETPTGAPLARNVGRNPWSPMHGDCWFSLSGASCNIPRGPTRYMAFTWPAGKISISMELNLFTVMATARWIEQVTKWSMGSFDRLYLGIAIGFQSSWDMWWFCAGSGTSFGPLSGKGRQIEGMASTYPRPAKWKGRGNEHHVLPCAGRGQSNGWPFGQPWASQLW